MTVVFKLLAIGTFTAFYGCYFAKLLSQRSRGIQTDQMGKGKAGLAKFVEIAMKLAAILVFAAGLVSVFLGAGRGPAGIRVIGAAMSAAGTAVFMIAARTMGDSWRAGVPQTDKTELVTGGIYQISRNPAFLGFDLLYIGTALMFSNWMLWGLTVFAVIMYHLQIVYVEEPFLLAAFGEEYSRYRGEVRRYVGRRRYSQNT